MGNEHLLLYHFMNDVTIIGAGPAGVSCAIWLKQLGFKVLLVDRNDRCGGLQLRNPFTNTWIATSSNVRGTDVASALNENVVAHGVPLRLNTECRAAKRVDKAWEVEFADGSIVLSKMLVLASGVVPRSGGLIARLGVLVGPGPQIANTDFSGARLAILGGGDSAFENYLFARQRGAAEITIFARTLRARPELMDQVPPEDVLLGPYEVDKYGRVNGKSYDQVLVLYGYEAGPSALLGLKPALRPDGFVLTDASCETSIPGLYAIGEIAQRAHPCCVTAMADGVIAAKAIQRHLEATSKAAYIGKVSRALAVAKRIAGA